MTEKRSCKRILKVRSSQHHFALFFFFCFLAFSCMCGEGRWMVQRTTAAVEWRWCRRSRCVLLMNINKFLSTAGKHTHIYHAIDGTLRETHKSEKTASTVEGVSGCWHHIIWINFSVCYHPVSSQDLQFCAGFIFDKSRSFFTRLVVATTIITII